MRQIGKHLARSAWLWTAATAAHAHAGEGSHALDWTWEPWFILSLLAAGGFYLAGCLRLSKEGNIRKVLGAGRVTSFGAGMLLLLIVALASPLDALALVRPSG